jgi:hypothetical protein
MKLEKGKWYVREFDDATCIRNPKEDEDFKSHTGWKEIEPPVIKVGEKPKTLADIKPKVGMRVKGDTWKPEDPPYEIVALGVTTCCAKSTGGRLGIIDDYQNWIVVEEPVKLSVEESLKPENEGKKGRWQRRDGAVIEDEFEWDGHATYPVDINGDCYTRGGKLWPHQESAGDLVAFLGWVKE